VTGRRPVRRLLVAASGARLAYAALTRTQPGGEQAWTRTNHRGEPVTLLEGPAVTVAAAATALAVPGLDAGQRLALGLAGAGSGAFGCYDDLAESGDRRGFRGHLGALAKGEVTTGAIKLVGIGLIGLASSVLLDRGETSRRTAGRAADVLINAGLVAGCANLMNLFDLRPGRAIKVSLFAGAALALRGPGARAAVAAPAGAAVALLPDDVGERAMLGDSGANALGAMLGVAAASALPRSARLAVLVGVAGLTAASEKVSFTKVIARTPPLHWLDMLGRRPAQAPAEPVPAGADPVIRAADGITPDRSASQSPAAADTPHPL
jgi:UDP-N-acetylmuramyl pentapeptide phosphotransferase/UDP-N-acetylglucosamine-1-phosphate transferase